MKLMKTSVVASAVFSLVAACAATALQPGATTPAKAEPAKAEPVKDASADAPKAAATEKLIYVKVDTSMGAITIELNNEKAPISVQNFLAYTDAGFYNGTIFHRVIDGFMIQGGGFDASMTQKPTRPAIKNEWQNGLKNTKGTVAMARLGDGKPNQATVDSATAQFFINVADNAFLDRPQPDGGAYAVFGRVVEGMDVVDKIKSVKTGNKGHQEAVPTTTVEIKTVTRLTSEEASKFAPADKPAEKNADKPAEKKEEPKPAK